MSCAAVLLLAVLASVVIGVGVGFYVGAYWAFRDQAHIPQTPPPWRNRQ